VESPMSMTFFARRILRPLLERYAGQFFGNIPKSGGRRGIACLGHDQRARRWAAYFPQSFGSVISAGLSPRVCRREKDRPRAVRRGLAEEWSRKIGRERKHPARTAREQ